MYITVKSIKRNLGFKGIEISDIVIALPMIILFSFISAIGDLNHSKNVVKWIIMKIVKKNQNAANPAFHSQSLLLKESIIAANKAIHNQAKIHFHKYFFTPHFSSSDNNNQ